MDYFAELIREKSAISAFPNHFKHIDRLIDLEIARVRAQLFNCNFFEDDLPRSSAELDSHEEDIIVTLQEKVYVPTKEYPEFNFVGRILGPRGMTVKQLEHATGCKLMVRGRGSFRDAKEEEAKRGKPSWEHLEDDLHILIRCEDTEKRALAKLENALDKVKKLLVPTTNGIDELKRKQMMELSIINGNYLPSPKNEPWADAMMMTILNEQEQVFKQKMKMPKREVVKTKTPKEQPDSSKRGANNGTAALPMAAINRQKLVKQMVKQINNHGIAVALMSQQRDVVASRAQQTPNQLPE